MWLFTRKPNAFHLWKAPPQQRCHIHEKSTIYDMDLHLHEGEIDKNHIVLAINETSISTLFQVNNLELRVDWISKILLLSISCKVYKHATVCDHMTVKLNGYSLSINLRVGNLVGYLVNHKSLPVWQECNADYQNWCSWLGKIQRFSRNIFALSIFFSKMADKL